MSEAESRSDLLQSLEKASWGDGPWLQEADREEWVDERTGLPCVILRNPFMGNLNGYVGVPEGNPFFLMDWGQPDVDVHGGLTFAADGKSLAMSISYLKAGTDHWWFGFDCGHAWDYLPAMAARIGALGLPPMPYQDVLPIVYRTIEYVRAECESLAAQLMGLATREDPRR